MLRCRLPACCRPGLRRQVRPRQPLWLPRCSQRQLALASSARKLLNSFRFCGSANLRSTPPLYGCRKKAQALQAEPRQRAKRLGWNILSAKSWSKSTAFFSKREQARLRHGGACFLCQNLCFKYISTHVKIIP